MRFEALIRRIAVASLSVTSIGCLPEDTRPPPGSVLATSTSDDAITSESFETVDGWTVAYDEFFIVLGSASVDECAEYSDTDYERLLDMKVVGAQKVSIQYALGTCDYEFELARSSSRTVLGDGVTEADLTFMRTPADDPYSEALTPTIYTRGRAERGDDATGFEIVYRRTIEYAKCEREVDDEVQSGIVVAADEETTIDLTVLGATPFYDGLGGSQAAARFQPFADADSMHGDGDGNVTLDDLVAMPLSEVRTVDRYADAEDEWTSLGDYVYRGLLPRFVRFQGTGECDIEVRGELLEPGIRP